MLDDSALGQRVVVRSRRNLAGEPPRLGDATGLLVALDADGVLLQARSGLIRLAAADIVAARVITPATRDVLALQRIAARGWRAAEDDELDGWQLRADHGWSRRANSGLPLSGVTRALPVLLGELADWYRARGLPALIQIPMPARQLLDGELHRLGWAAEGHSVVLTRPVGVEHPRGSEVVLAPLPSAGWLAFAGDPPEAVISLLSRHQRVAFASVALGGELVAIGRGAVDDQWLGISSLSVAPQIRRSGLGTGLIAALNTWARDEHGATECYLQVEAANSDALELYRHLRFIPHHRYHYRRAPGNYADRPTRR